METITNVKHRKKKSTAKTSLVIAIVFHVIIFCMAGFWAAKEGYAGKQLQALTASLVVKEKKMETPKTAVTKPEERKVEAAKIVEQAKTVVAEPPKDIPPPPPAYVDNTVPPPVNLGNMEFGDVVVADAITVYKDRIEKAIFSKWQRPKDIKDDEFVAEVEMTIDPTGKIAGYEWKKGSGNDRWDGSVKQVFASVSNIGKPPKDFPPKFVVRFDVVTIE